jgi:PadR family transcriptional regulator
MTGTTARRDDLLKGTLDLLILKSLSRGTMHGYDITEYLRATSADVLQVEEGALYPALHRLEVAGLLDAEWGLSVNNRRAKFYKLTAAGRKQLTAEAAYWSRMSAAIGSVLTAS